MTVSSSNPLLPHAYPTDVPLLHKNLPTRVLVVDDDRDTTDLLRIVLEPKSFEVITANSGDAGIDLVRRYAPDVVIVDLLMPGMDGLKVLRAIRQFSSIPVLILSAVNRPNMAEQALDDGADDFMVKPMSSGMLVASIRMLARRSRAEQCWRKNHRDNDPFSG